jgi:hypothetical protein
MITIDHSKRGNYRKVTCECLVNVSYLCKNELCELTTNYLLGLQKPHYPVPSTITLGAEDFFAVYYAIELMGD